MRVDDEYVDRVVGVEEDLGQVWSEWGRITRFLESARLAFARERNLWASLEIAAADEVRLSAPPYRVALKEHLAAVQSEDTLFGGVLIHSYALAEAAASDRLGASSRTFNGIEDWGTRLLASNGETWDGVKDGLAGAVEVAVVRNAYAHGARDLDRGAAKRLRTAGRAEAATGDPVNLDYATLKRFRGRLRNLLGAGGVRRAS